MNPELYISIYYNILLIFVLIIFLIPINNTTIRKPYYNNSFLSWALIIFVFIHITFRPLHYLFGDTRAYANYFIDKKLFGMNYETKDYGFEFLTYFSSLFVNLTSFFGILCLLYILPIYKAFKEAIPKQYFIALLVFVCAFSFWGYGVNGLRNGIATSFVIYGILTPKKIIWKILIFFIAFSFHKSVLLPISAYILTYLYNNSKFYIGLWLVFLIASLTTHAYFENVLGGLTIFENDDRLNLYLSGGDADLFSLFSRIGFRWDFVGYSVIPIILGYIYIYRLNFRDRIYINLYNIYLMCNAFWLLVIYIPYSNRFAYLSWFIYPIILIYPLLKKDLVYNQPQKIKWIILLNYMFTYFMWFKG